MSNGLMKVRIIYDFKRIFNSKELIAIHCDTKDKAIKLFKEFRFIGIQFDNNDSYVSKDYWDMFSENTCYSNYKGFGSTNYYLMLGSKVIPFEEIEFDNSDETSKRSETMNKISIRSVTLNKVDKITTVMFTDGDVKMVKCGEHDVYAPDLAIAYCIALKATGESKTSFKKMISKYINKKDKV